MEYSIFFTTKGKSLASKPKKGKENSEEGLALWIFYSTRQMRSK